MIMVKLEMMAHSFSPFLKHFIQITFARSTLLGIWNFEVVTTKDVMQGLEQQVRDVLAFPTLTTEACVPLFLRCK